MKKTYHKILIALALGLVLMLVLNHVALITYDGHRDMFSPLLVFFFSPLLFILDLINLIIPIEGTTLFRAVLAPKLLELENAAASEQAFNQLATFFIGSLWMFLLVYSYFSFDILKKWPLIKIGIYVMTIFIVSYTLSTVHPFGFYYGRWCPGCP